MDDWLGLDVWQRAGSIEGRESAHMVTVVDPDLGAIAELTDLAGNRFYGVDQRATQPASTQR